MILTPRNICTLALKLCGALGVGQTPLAEDINDTFSMLNMMMGQWSQKRWLVYHLLDVPFVSTGASSYTIGVGGAINTARPDRIEAAYARQNSGGYPIDYPLEVIEAREEWNEIWLKTMPGSPAAVFYDSGFPLGIVYVSPVPSAQYEIHLSLKQPLSAFINLSDQINLPDEYQEAILYNLAVRLFAIYGLPMRSDVVMIAKAALNTIRNSNTQIATLRMPGNLPGVRRWGGGGTFWGGVGIGPVGTPVPIVPPGSNSGDTYANFVLDQNYLDQAILLPGDPNDYVLSVNGTVLLGADNVALSGADGAILVATS